MYLNCVDITSIILIIIGIIFYIIGLIKKNKKIKLFSFILFLAVFTIWMIIVFLGLSEKEPEEYNKNNVNELQEEYNNENIIYDENTYSIENATNENGKITDVTEKIVKKENYDNGIIYSIDDKKIYFKNDNDKKFSYDKNIVKYINGRTSKDISVDDINIGDFVFFNIENALIYRNISGEELHQELLYNLALKENERYFAENTVSLKNVKQIGNNIICTIEYGDILGNTLSNEMFEDVVEFTSNTKISSKGNNIHLDNLKDAAYNINSIILDKNTINKKKPAIVLEFYSSDN